MGGAASSWSRRRGSSVFVLLLLAGPAVALPLSDLLVLPLPERPVEGAPLQAAPLHPGLSALDVSFALARLARGDAAALEVLAPFRAGAQALSLPAETLAPVLDPPPLRATLLALARDHPGAVSDAEAGRILRSVSLPADVERALSSLGQAALGATALARAGQPLEAGALLQIATEHARPSLERHAILLGHPRAYTGLSWNEPGTRRQVDAFAAAQGEQDVLAGLGLDLKAPPVHPLALSAELAELYARLGLPMGFEERAALAAADGLDPRLREPLAEALARVREAARLRDQAYAALSADERDVLLRTDEVTRAVAASRPTDADLLLLSRYGNAVSALDADALALGASHLLAASRGLASLEGLEGCCEAPALPLAAGFAAGGLVVTWTVDGDVRVRVGQDEDAPQRDFTASNASYDPERGQLTVFGDADGDGQGDETLLRTPPLRWPSRDVLFMDPYGLVLVTGRNATLVDGVFAGRMVEVSADAVPSAPDATAPILAALDAFDALLRPDPSADAWPWARDEARDALRGLGGDPVPRHVSALVNPWAYQALHVDLGGDDVFTTNAAGAGDKGLVTLWADGAGGALHSRVAHGPVPASLLVDLGGSDRYQTRDRHTLASANASLALLVDRRGDDRFEANGSSALASAVAGGFGLLLGGPGDSTYAARNGSLAHAAGAGTALLLDRAGEDSYQGGNGSLAASDLGAHALLMDLGGNDTYRSANFSQAASRGGLALLLDADGRDKYAAMPAAWSQGYAEPARASSLPCPSGAPCVAEPGPSRIALLLDGAGADIGACREGRVSNGALGSVGFGRDPLAAGPFNPAYGVCVDSDADPTRAGGALPGAGRPFVDVPATFFTSSFGNFTLPGLARLGSLGPDLVREPYVLSVDLLGDDAYGVGAVATLNASRAGWDVDLGYVAPVSLLLDLDGRDLFDTRLAGARVPGAFGWADGGVAVQAKLAARRVDDERYAPGLWNATRDPANATRETLVETDVGRNRVNESDRFAPPVHEARYRNVSHGLASATNGGLALVLSQGVSMEVSAAPDVTPGASCRLACARQGGVALLLSDGGAGDRIVASPFSMGTVDEGPLGGLALYTRRGGPDVFEGSNESMGVARPFPSPTRSADPFSGHAGLPNVALFLKDGFAQDLYAENMRLPGLERAPRGNERAWEDEATWDAFRAQGSRSLHVARGVDNLDWYLHMNLAAADRGVSPDQGPGSPFHPAGAAGEASRRWATLPPVGGVSLRDTMNRTPPVGPLVNALVNWTADDPTTSAPARVPGADPGDGGSTTGPYGVKPVTMARTAFSPLVNLTAIKTVGPYEAPHRKAFLGDVMLFRVSVKNPPTFADQTYGKPTATARPNPDGDAISRVELVVQGTGPRWKGCPYPEKADLVEPGACVVARWDRRTDPPLGTPEVRRYLGETQLTEWEIYWNANGAVPGTSSTPAFPPGPYVVTVRAFADRPDGVPVLTPYGVRDHLLEALASDALNHTDDSYGLFGAVYHLGVPVYNVPSLDVTTERVRDSDGERPASFTVEVSSPVTSWVNVTTRTGAIAKGGRLGPIQSPYFDDPDGDAADGNDYLNFTWAPGDNPPGRYRATIQFVSKHNPAAKQTYVKDVYIDPDAPAAKHDPRGVPGGVVTRADAPDGRFTVPIQMDPTANVDGSRIAGVHLWVQEDLLDAADPFIVLERKPWAYHRLATDLGSMTVPFPVAPGEPDEWMAPKLHGDPFPGPPRVYRVAAYVEDRAGNVVPEDPLTRAPSGPDCVAGVCAQYLYDITPPRTRLALEEPSGESGRVGAGNLTLRVDASETPDVQRALVYAAFVRPEDAEAFETARLGIEPDPPAALKDANVSLRRPWDAPLLAAKEGLFTEGAQLDVSVLVENADKSRLVDGFEANEFNASRPLWLRAEFVDAANRTTAGPYFFNVTHLLQGPLLPGLNATLRLPGIMAPETSGVHRLRVGVDEERSGANVASSAKPRSALLVQPLVVWARLPEAEAGLVEWETPERFRVDGAALHLLSRGVDRVGNVEEKTEHDLRLVVDLSPPRLVRAPTVVASGFGATFLWETDEPCTCAVAVLDANGTPVGTAASSLFGTEHEATVENLHPERPYSYVLTLRDALGNAANLTAFNGSALRLRTGPALGLALDPPPALLSAPTNLSWVASNMSALNLTYHLRLSLDGGRTFPVNLTGEGLRAFETGGQLRTLALDPARHPESATARLRLDAVPEADPDVVTSILSPIFVLDGRGPTLDFRAATDLSAYARGPIALRADATDRASGLATFELSRDNETWTPADGNLAVEGDEPVLLWFRAKDKAGHLTAPAPLKVLLDGRAPTGSAKPDATAPTARASLLVHVEGSDSGAGLARIVASENATKWNLTLPAATLAQGTGSFAWPLLSGPQGARRLDVAFHDKAGNLARQEIVVTVDRRAPQAQVEATDVATTSATLHVEPDEPARVLAQVPGIAPVSMDALKRAHDLRVEGLRPGVSHLALVRVFDEAGNEGVAHVVFTTRADAQRPSAVQGLRTQPLPEGAVLLTWQPATDDDRVAFYRVLRADVDARAWEAVGEAYDVAYVDATGTPGASYAYRVVAVDRSGNLAFPSEDRVERVRTAPVLSNLTLASIRLPGGAPGILVQARLEDRDGDAPDVEVRTGDHRAPMQAFPLGDGSWRLEARLEAPPGRLMEARTLHVLARDGLFEARQPEAGGIRLPFVPEESTSPAGFLLGAARSVPAPALALSATALLLTALAVALVLRAQRRRRG